MSNTISYILLIILLVLLFLVMRRQATLKISRVIDDKVIVPITSKPSSFGRFGVIPTGDFLPTMIDATKPLTNTTLNVHNPSLRYKPSTQTLIVPSISSTLTGNVNGNASTASNLNKTDVTGCCRILYQRDANTTDVIGPGTMGQVLVSQGAGQPPVWSNISGGGDGGGGGGSTLPYQTKVEIPLTSPQKPVSLTLAELTDFIPLLGDPVTGISSGLVFNTSIRKLLISQAGTYRINMLVNYSTTLSVRTVTLRVNVGVLNKYTSSSISTGFPWSPTTIGYKPYALTNIDVVVNVSDVGKTFEVGAFTTAPNTGWKEKTVPMSAQPGSYISIQKIS